MTTHDVARVPEVVLGDATLWPDVMGALGLDAHATSQHLVLPRATTRQRFILMARSDGRPVHWPVATHAKKTDDAPALFPTVKPWRPAREIIDWEIKGKSISNRKKPLWGSQQLEARPVVRKRPAGRRPL